MSNSITLKHSHTSGGNTDTYQQTITAGSLKDLQESIPDSSTDLAVAFTLDYSACKYLLIYSDAAVTIKTNSSSTPDDTLAVPAGKPYVWADGMLHTLLITADITGLFVTNSSGGAAALRIVALEDPTP